MRAKKDVRGPSSLAGLRRHGMVMPADSRGCGCVGSDASSQTSSLSRRSSGQDRGGDFLRIGRGDDRRAGDLRQLPPLPLWRRLVAVGRGDDAGGQISVPLSSTVFAVLAIGPLPRRASTPFDRVVDHASDRGWPYPLPAGRASPAAPCPGILAFDGGATSSNASMCTAFSTSLGSISFLHCSTVRPAA